MAWIDAVPRPSHGSTGAARLADETRSVQAMTLLDREAIVSPSSLYFRHLLAPGPSFSDKYVSTARSFLTHFRQSYSGLIQAHHGGLLVMQRET
jgi:hypothetical protein